MQRKDFLKTIPLLGIGSGISLMACSTGGGVGAGDVDLTGDNLILTQAAEREAIAIQTYNATTSSGLITDQGILDTAVAYRDHHIEHLELFNDLLIAGESDEVNLNEFGADSRINNASTQEDAVVLAMTLEMEAADSYFTSSIRDLQGPTAREIMGSIFPIEVSHFVSLKAAIGRNPVINAAVFTNLSLGN